MSMIKVLAFIVSCFIITFYGCKDKKVEVTITNRSDSNIDSVLFPLTKSKWINIPPGKSKKDFVDVSDVQSGHEGLLPLLIYQGSKKINWSWGFHDFGYFNEKERYYVFENGINTVDVPLRKPDTLTIIFINRTNNKIDSFRANSLKSYKFRQTYHELVFAFSEFQKDPNFMIYQNKIPIKASVDHDWNNWNSNQEFLYLYNNGIVSKTDSL